jgi:transcriptional regulator with XRE-family HTH domain
MLESEAARTLSERLRLIRVELYGEMGAETLSARLGIAPGTWANYESGVLPAASVLLRFIEVTGVHPLWLLDGREPRHLVPGRDSSLSRVAEWIDRHRRGPGGRAATD